MMTFIIEVETHHFVSHGPYKALFLRKSFPMY